SLNDMTLPQFRVLSVIASSSERANRIAEKAAMSRPSLTGLLDGLEARGWVQRVDVEGDRRGVSLEVTRAGADALKQAERAMTAARPTVVERWTVADVAITPRRPPAPWLILPSDAGLFGCGAAFVRRYSGGRVSLDMQYALPNAVYERLQRLDFASHDQLQTG